ncbi:MAG: hypothetical protein JXI33_08105 [Candidatus Aminicenantes bacterium]|nr:hypothetical protein [Candidatus Aminicenantes bacterium]
MHITTHEAQESLAAIDAMMQKMRRSAAEGGTHYFLILWGVIWFFGFLGSHFFSGKIAGYIWMGLDILGGFSSWLIGKAMRRRVRHAGNKITNRRVALFWLTLFLYCMLTVWIAGPVDSKKLAMYIVLFAMIGWVAMGFLLSLSIVRLALLITLVALAGYFLLPGYFFLWMALLGSGTMIGCGFFIRFRWPSS